MRVNERTRLKLVGVSTKRECNAGEYESDGRQVKWVGLGQVVLVPRECRLFYIYQVIVFLGGQITAWEDVNRYRTGNVI